MTSTINNITATTTVNPDGTVKLTVGGKVVGDFGVDHITAIVTALLAGRKEAYSVTRTAKAAERTAAKAAREAKATERKAAQAKTAADRVAKLKERLAAAEKKAAAKAA